jgi:chromosome partitioning protein
MKNVDLLPSRFEIGLFDLLTSNKNQEVKEFSLKNEISKIKEKYDFIFIDCSPSLGILNKLALIASDSLLIPIQPEEFSMSGITQLLAVIKYMQQELNPTLHVEGVLITMLDRRLTASTEMLMEISKTFGEYVYRDIIPRDTIVSKSQMAKKSLLDFDP